MPVQKMYVVSLIGRQAHIAEFTSDDGINFRAEQKDFHIVVNPFRQIRNGNVYERLGQMRLGEVGKWMVQGRDYELWTDNDETAKLVRSTLNIAMGLNTPSRTMLATP